MLKDVQKSANYTCVAKSDLGHIEAIAQVKVKGMVIHDMKLQFPSILILQ